ncbi:MAG: pilus assembly protein [Deltaproteobacteria bacterium]|nr:MAG: pilus assembly protein [Deltaproteobacteria bacterium]
MRDRRHEAGQALFEFGVTLPILMALVLGVIEFGYALFQVQLVTSMAREGSNLIARQVTINDAEAALQTMSGLVSFDANSTLILSVVRLGVGGANNNVPIIVQRHSVGAFAASSVLGDPPQSAYQGSPDYNAYDPDNDGSIRVSGVLPNGFTLTPGESVYVTEVFTQRTSIVPFMPLPAMLHASAYF